MNYPPLIKTYPIPAVAPQLTPEREEWLQSLSEGDLVKEMHSCFGPEYETYKILKVLPDEICTQSAAYSAAIPRFFYRKNGFLSTRNGPDGPQFVRHAWIVPV